MGEALYGILDAERELIATLQADPRGYRAVCHLLRPEHFLSSIHQRQFAAIATAIERGRPPGRPDAKLLAGLPPIDPLDHALMIYGSYLGRMALEAATPALAM